MQRDAAVVEDAKSQVKVEKIVDAEEKNEAEKAE